MTPKDKHPSMRGYFAYELYQYMSKDDRIWLVVGDLGYKIFDHHFKDFPERCINTGAAEQAMIDIAVGLSREGKIPVVYSITTFLLMRPFEQLRTYVNYEKIPVKLVGSGRDKDYAHDGISHWAEDAPAILSCLPNIMTEWPKEKEDIHGIMRDFIYFKTPSFISLKR